MFTIKSRVVAAAAASLVALGVAAAAPASARPVATPTAHTTVSVHDATTAKSRFVQFRSPSHNIYCHIATSKHASESRCDILKHSYAVPAQAGLVPLRLERRRATAAQRALRLRQ